MIGLREDWYSTYGSKLNPRVGAGWRSGPGGSEQVDEDVAGVARRPTAQEPPHEVGLDGTDDSGLAFGFEFSVALRVRPEQEREDRDEVHLLHSTEEPLFD